MGMAEPSAAGQCDQCDSFRYRYATWLGGGCGRSDSLYCEWRLSVGKPAAAFGCGAQRPLRPGSTARLCRGGARSRVDNEKCWSEMDRGSDADERSSLLNYVCP